MKFAEEKVTETKVNGRTKGYEDALNKIAEICETHMAAAKALEESVVFDTKALNAFIEDCFFKTANFTEVEIAFNCETVKDEYVARASSKVTHIKKDYKDNGEISERVFEQYIKQAFIAYSFRRLKAQEKKITKIANTIEGAYELINQNLGALTDAQLELLKYAIADEERRRQEENEEA